MACRYSWDYMDAMRRSEATIHDSLHCLYLKMSDPLSVTSFTTNEQYEAICNHPENRPFFRDEEGVNEEEGMKKKWMKGTMKMTKAVTSDDDYDVILLCYCVLFY